MARKHAEEDAFAARVSELEGKIPELASRVASLEAARWELHQLEILRRGIPPARLSFLALPTHPDPRLVLTPDPGCGRIAADVLADLEGMNQILSLQTIPLPFLHSF